MRTQELIDNGFVNANPEIARLWVSHGERLFWVDFGTSEEIEEGLDEHDRVIWDAVLTYAESKIARIKAHDLPPLQR